MPYLAARRDWNVVSWTLIFAAVFTLLPAAWFGFAGNLALLGQWSSQEFSTQFGQNEIWFPNQALRGVLMRYLTVIDYSQLPDSNYPLVHFAAVDARTVRAIWVVLAGLVYCGLLVIAHLRKDSDGLIEHGLAFCLLALLEPFTQKYALVVLLWPAIVAGRLIRLSAVRILVYMTAALVLIQPLAPRAAAQRLLQVMGLDFAATALLAIAMAYASLQEENNLTL